MTPKPARLSRRSFVENSALALGSIGALAATRAYGAESPSPTAGQVTAQEHGAKGDGITDDTKALQAALEAAKANSPICYLPPGLYRLNGALIVPPGVTLCGASGGVPHSEHPIGTVLLAFGGRGQADGEPLITLKSNAVVRNLTIHYPEQALPDVAPYPWSIRADGELCQILDVCLTNPYQAIDVGTKWNELHLVRNVFACPLKIGIYIDQCTDIGRIENVHFNPNFWTRMALKPGFRGGDIKAYLEKNLVGFKIGKTDWEFISNSFVIFPRIGFHFDDFGHGPGNAVVTQSGSDICPVAVRVDRTQAHAGAQFTNGQFMSTIEIGPENRGPVKFSNRAMHLTLVDFLPDSACGTVSADDYRVSRLVCYRTNVPRLHRQVAMAGWICLPTMPSRKGLDHEAREVLVHPVRLPGFGDSGHLVPRHAQTPAPLV
jgi:hypothetical protein